MGLQHLPFRILYIFKIFIVLKAAYLPFYFLSTSVAVTQWLERYLRWYKVGGYYSVMSNKQTNKQKTSIRAVIAFGWALS